VEDSFAAQPFERSRRTHIHQQMAFAIMRATVRAFETVRIAADHVQDTHQWRPRT
jgi:hypothetical protein